MSRLVVEVKKNMVLGNSVVFFVCFFWWVDVFWLVFFGGLVFK